MTRVITLLGSKGKQCKVIMGQHAWGWCSTIPSPHRDHRQMWHMRPGDNTSKPKKANWVDKFTWMYQVRCLKPWSPSLSVISAAFIAFGKSCLLAKTSRRASRRSSSFNMRWSSSRASETRSRSLESTTKIIPCVFWKSFRAEIYKLKRNREETEGIA